jgi:penicillin-binding protein 2
LTLGKNSPGRDLKVRYVWLGGVMLLGLMMLAVRLYRLQITRGEEFGAKSVENFVKELRIPADRGMLLDTTGRILVDSRPSFDVLVTPAFCGQCADEVLPKLAVHLGWDSEQLNDALAMLSRAKRSAPFRPVPIRIDITREQAETLDAHRTELPGIEVQASPHRNYRSGAVLSHVIGYMNEITQEELDRLNGKGAAYSLGEYIGRRGIEKAFEHQLRGRDGERKQVVDARGQPIPGLSELVGGAQLTDPYPGNNVILSLDMRLQEEADRAFPGKAGTVVVVDVKTGFILAMLSRPGFDPNLLTGRITGAQMAALSKDPLKPMMNRATAMHYSPGSAFKVVTMLAALRENVFTEHSAVNCPGSYRLGSRAWRCHKESGHGVVNARTAMQMSCDTFFYRAADLMGIDPIAREGRELGLGAPTGITGLLEEPGIIPDSHYHDRVTPGGYTKGMALNTAIGQGDVNVTPLQLAMVYATIANGGKLYRPQLVRRVESPDGKVMQSFEADLIRTVDMNREHRRVVVDGLMMAVNAPGGTAYTKRLPDIVVAGKTGTAQVARIGQKTLKTEQMDYWVRHHAWFAAFAPAQDPEIAVVVLHEHGGHGGMEAAPTAMAVIQKYFDLKKADQGVVTAAAPSGPPTPLPAGGAMRAVARRDRTARVAQVQPAASPESMPPAPGAVMPLPSEDQALVRRAPRSSTRTEAESLEDSADPAPLFSPLPPAAAAPVAGSPSTPPTEGG